MSYHTFTGPDKPENTCFHLDPKVLKNLRLLQSNMIEIEQSLKKTKQKMPDNINNLLIQYKTTKDAQVLNVSTFKYIVKFKETGKQYGRLRIALGDFGYTLEEINNLTIDQIINEIINRA